MCIDSHVELSERSSRSVGGASGLRFITNKIAGTQSMSSNEAAWNCFREIGINGTLQTGASIVKRL